MLLMQCLFGPRSCSGSPLFHRGHHRSGTHGVGRALRYRRHYGKHGREDAWTCKGSLHGKASISSLGRAAGCKTSIFALSASWPPGLNILAGALIVFRKTITQLQPLLLAAQTDAVRALKSSLNARKILVRNVCNRVRHDSPGKIERRELIDWVATIGMHLACRDSAKNFSSLAGSLSPTVAKL
jgi:hypothetical protein